MNPTLSAIVDASEAYTQSQRTLDGLRDRKALLLSEIDEINAKIAAIIPVVKANKDALKVAAGAL